MSAADERPVVRVSVRGRAAQDVDAEFAFHIDMRTRELIAGGMDADAAVAEARRQFGDIAGARDYCHDIDQKRETRMFRRELLSDVRQDVVLALRALRRAPGFSIVAILTLALGVGATTSIFSVVSGILLRPLPFEEPANLVLLASTYDGNVTTSSPANIADFRTRASSFTSIATLEGRAAVLTDAGDPVRLPGYAVSPDFFQLLGVRPIIGRASFTDAEGTWQGPKAALLHEAVWRSRFGADSSLVGRVITLDGERYEVAGIIPAAAAWPTGAQLWTPFTYDPDKLESSRGALYLSTIARLRPGVSLEQAQSDVRGVAAQLVQEHPDDNPGLGAHVESLHEWITGDLKRPLLVLLGGTVVALLIACANVANLLLVRSVTRDGELAVRTALGAGRGRLIRQLVTEGAVLSLLGGAAGFALAIVGTRVLVSIAPPTIPRLSAIEVDAHVLAFTVLVAIFTGVVFGLMPARQLLRSDVSSRLRDGGRGSTSHIATVRVRRGLVIAEVALSVTLLAGAGLLIRSFDRLMNVDPGFRTDRGMSFAISLPAASYTTPESRWEFLRRLEERLNGTPGIETAGAALGMPLTPFSFGFTFTIAGRPPLSPADEPAAEVRVATPSYFAAMGIPIVRGRGFSDADRDGAGRVLLIAESAAKEFFPNEDPIGKHVTFGWSRNGQPLEGDIVGVAGDVKQSSLANATLPQFWVPFAQWPVNSFTVVMRTTGEPRSVATAARNIVRELDRTLAVTSERTLEDIVSMSVATPQFYMTLLSAFATVALLLSAVGVYGVIAFLVGQRQREIGIRVALGASRASVARLVLREGMLMTGTGLAIGVAGALAVTQVMRQLLFEITPTDAPTYLLVVVVLSVVAALASLVPAISASRVDPVVAMRGE